MKYTFHREIYKEYGDIFLNDTMLDKDCLNCVNYNIGGSRRSNRNSRLLSFFFSCFRSHCSLLKCKFCGGKLELMLFLSQSLRISNKVITLIFKKGET